MKPQVKRVTLTGADDSVSVSSVLRLAEDFPHAEIALLFAPNRLKPRYPSTAWVREFAQAFHNRPTQVSLHLCAGFGQAILRGELPKLPIPLEELPAGRIQINFTGFEPIDPVALANRIAQIQADFGIQTIFQLKPNTKQLLATLAGLTSIDVLHDASGGKGIIPDNWPSLPDFAYREVGYAGGLSPDKITDQLAGIAERTGDKPINIDFETSLREPGKPDQYSIERSQMVLSISSRYVLKL